jgi:hypothetical protein
MELPAKMDASNCAAARTVTAFNVFLIIRSVYCPQPAPNTLDAKSREPSIQIRKESDSRNLEFA